MKAHVLLIMIAASSLLVTMPSAMAMPPRQHSVNGMVEGIDCTSQTITLKPKDGGEPLTFVWNESTRFTKKGGCAKCSLDSGQTVKVWYRREVGQNVLREVNTKGTTTECGAGCKSGRP